MNGEIDSSWNCRLGVRLEYAWRWIWCSEVFVSVYLRKFCCSTYRRHGPTTARGHCRYHKSYSSKQSDHPKKHTTNHTYISLNWRTSSFAWYFLYIYIYISSFWSLFRAPVCTSSTVPNVAPFFTLSSQPNAFNSPASPPTPIPLALSQPISSTLSWGQMMTPREVIELLAPQPQIGEYYVVTKGRRPGVYLSWWVFHFSVNVLFV